MSEEARIIGVASGTTSTAVVDGITYEGNGIGNSFGSIFMTAAAVFAGSGKNVKGGATISSVGSASGTAKTVLCEDTDITAALITINYTGLAFNAGSKFISISRTGVGGGINSSGGVLYISKEMSFTLGSSEESAEKVIFRDNLLQISADDTTDDVQVGGAAIFSYGNISIANAVFEGNTVEKAVTDGGSVAAGYGGAVFLRQGGGQITDTVFTSNSAADGGALYIWGATGDVYTLGNLTFSGNSATNGGALFVRGTVDYSVKLTDTVTLETASDKIYFYSASAKLVADTSSLLSGGAVTKEVIINKEGNSDWISVRKDASLPLYLGDIQQTSSFLISGDYAGVRDNYGYAVATTGAEYAESASGKSKYGFVTSDHAHAYTYDGVTYFGNANATVNEALSSGNTYIFATGEVAQSDASISGKSAVYVADDVTVTGDTAALLYYNGGSSSISAGSVFKDIRLSVGSDAVENKAGRLILATNVTLGISGTADEHVIFEDVAVTSSKDGSKGGVITVNNATVNISYTDFTGNKTVKESDTSSLYGRGGVIYVHDASSVLTIDNAVFSDNHARSGGAIMAGNGTVTITNSVFSGNSADESGSGSYDGGAIRQNNGTMTISGCTFKGNVSNSGGAVYSAASGSLTVNNTTFATSSDTLYSAGSLTLKGNITTAAAFTVSGTVKADGAKITLDYSAANKAGYISNLAAFSAGSTYTLSALLADDVTSGIYTLAGGAADYTGTITVKNSAGSIVENLAVGSAVNKNGIGYSLAVNDSAELVLTVTDKLVLSGDISDEKGNYTNTTGASVVVNGANITNNLYAAVSGDATLTVTSGKIKNIFAGAKFEADATTGDITAAVGGGGDITTTRIYGGNAVLGGTVETVNTTLTISGALIWQVQKDGVWCYGAGIAASQTKDGTTTSGTLKITGTSKVEVTAPGSVGSIVGGGRAQNSGSLDVNATSVTIGSSATVTNAIGGAYNSGSGRVSVGTAEMSISSQNVTTVFGGNFIAPVSDGVLSNVNSIDNVKLTINGAVASNAIFGGNYMKAGEASIENVKININGADSACGIYGGGFIVGAASETIGEVNITVSGTVVGNIFAGACVSGVNGSSTVTSANITVEAGSNVTGNIYAGGYSVAGTAAVGACTITFSGASAFNGKVCAASAGSVTTAAPNPSTVVFSGYSGDFGGAFAGTFDVIEFTADSSVNFNGSDNIIFDGLKTNAVQITGMDTVTYSADADHVLFSLGSRSIDINKISVNGATLQSGISESSFTYFWNESTQEFGYAGAEAIKSYTTDSSYKLYQLTANA